MACCQTGMKRYRSHAHLFVQIGDIICETLFLCLQILLHRGSRDHHKPVDGISYISTIREVVTHILPTPLYTLTPRSILLISSMVSWRMRRSRSLAVVCCRVRFSVRCDWTAVCWICTRIYVPSISCRPESVVKYTPYAAYHLIKSPWHRVSFRPWQG